MTTVLTDPIFQGEGKWFPFEVVDLNGNAIDVTGKDFVFQIRETVGGTLVYAATNFDITEAADGIVKANLPASQTLVMDPGAYLAQFLVVVQTDTDVEIGDYVKFKIKAAVVTNRVDTSPSASASRSKSPSASPSESPSKSPSTSPSVSVSPSVSPSL